MSRSCRFLRLLMQVSYVAVSVAAGAGALSIVARADGMGEQHGASASLAVSVDHVRLLRLGRSASDVIIGNPAIADVAVRDSRLLVITGKSSGETNLIVLDHDGREIINRTLSVGQRVRHSVTVYQGTSRQSLHCDPVCERIIAAGDDKAAFEAVAGAVAKKIGIAETAARKVR